MPKLDPIQQSIVDDFERIISTSDRMRAAYDMLPAAERKTIQAHALEWAWQVMLVAAEPKHDRSNEDAAAYYKSFGGFVLNCQDGMTARFITSDWIAMDRDSYTVMKERSKGRYE